jgi:hypothetical protein
MWTIPTPTPQPSVVLDTQQFIQAGRSGSAEANTQRRMTQLDSLIDRNFGVVSMSRQVAYQLSEIDRSNSKLNITNWAEKNHIIYQTLAPLSEAAAQEKAPTANFMKNRQSIALMQQVSFNLNHYAKTKYSLLIGQIQPDNAARNMSVYRSRATAAALKYDRLMLASTQNAG